MNTSDIYNIVLHLSVFIIAGSIHEFAHAASACKLGDDTAKNAGRMTINPLAHIDPIGTILLPILMTISFKLGFGWMKPVPVNPYNLGKPLRDTAIISFAGPYSNFTQACLAILVLHLIGRISPELAVSTPFIWKIIRIYALMNIVLMGFNLIPVPPLDGGGILMYFLPSHWRLQFERFSRFGFIFLMILFAFGLLRYFLYPFFTMFNFIAKLDMPFLIILNLANIGVIVYFFKKKFSSHSKKTAFAGSKILKQTKDESPDKNKILITSFKKIRSKVENKETLTDSDIKNLKKIHEKIKENANICPPVDFNADDPTCQDCDWIANCMERHFKKYKTASK
ncbi:MAG: site-2 protease family protein [Spirochaetes bacterium]|nr:site-2 protease family protein [Spirochaetota bacterium]